MAGLELLFNCVANSITCSQDALICFVHWEIVKNGYKCLGIGDEPKDGEKKSELLPPGWSESKELYALRYRSNDDKSNLLEYVDEANLQTFESVFKNTDELITKGASRKDGEEDKKRKSLKLKGPSQ
uniref:Proteasome inhibitor PI31 subunit n=1 Tax=Sinocyclocheilus rhinocerous TaxID=307959 RepID=A0A673L0G3_9TELE